MQIRTHAQKYFLKLEKEFDGLDSIIISPSFLEKTDLDDIKSKCKVHEINK
jgi:hypothetical protein